MEYTLYLLQCFVHIVKSNVAVNGINNLEELDTLTLQCTATPSAMISWLKRSSEGIKVISSSSRISLSTQQVTGNGGQLTTVRSLIIEHVTASDSAEYVCEAENGPGSIPTTESIQVNINGKEVLSIIHVHNT